jgi:hypothetical protein
MDRRLGGPRAGLEDMEKSKFLTLLGLELRPLGRPARNQSLYRLSHPELQMTRYKKLNWLLRNVINYSIHYKTSTKYCMIIKLEYITEIFGTSEGNETYKKTSLGITGFLDFVHRPVLLRTQRFGNRICFRPQARVGNSLVG